MKLEAVIPAMITPFDEAEEIDFPGLERLTDVFIEAGVGGLVPCGSTGEYYAMTAEERADILKCVMDAAGGRVPLIAGTNGGSTREVIRHSEAARKLGYTTILLAPPYYSLPSQEELIAHFQAVLDAVDVEIVLYNFPARAGVEISMELLEAFKDNARVISIKESSGNLPRAMEMSQRFADSYQLCCGSDDQVLDFYLWGFTSWICGPANALLKPCIALDKALMGGNIPEAQRLMKSLLPAMASLEGGKFVQKVKYGCELHGLPAGPTRMPLMPLSNQEKAEFKAALEVADAAVAESRPQAAE